MGYRKILFDIYNNNTNKKKKTVVINEKIMSIDVWSYKGKYTDFAFDRVPCAEVVLVVLFLKKKKK